MLRCSLKKEDWKLPWADGLDQMSVILIMKILLAISRKATAG